MKLYPLFFSLCALFIISCSTKNNSSSNSAKTISQSDEIAVVDSTVSIFNTSIHLNERLALQELSTAGLLTCGTLKDTNGQFNGTVVEFAGIKFGFNKGFVFITSNQDKQSIDSLVSKISSYYGAPNIDDNGDPEYNYYYNPKNEKCILGKRKVQFSVFQTYFGAVV